MLALGFGYLSVFLSLKRGKAFIHLLPYLLMGNALIEHFKILLYGYAADIALLMVYLNALLIDGDIYRKIHYEHDYVEICADAERAVGK